MSSVTPVVSTDDRAASPVTSSFAPRGAHVIADLTGLPAEVLDDPVSIESLMRTAAAAAGARVVAAHFHHFGAQGGVTGVLLLAESHLSIHTWPEAGFAAIDAFMCGDAQADCAVDALIAAFSRGGTPLVRRHRLMRSV